MYGIEYNGVAEKKRKLVESNTEEMTEQAKQLKLDSGPSSLVCFDPIPKKAKATKANDAEAPIDNWNIKLYDFFAKKIWR